MYKLNLEHIFYFVKGKLKTPPPFLLYEMGDRVPEGGFPVGEVARSTRRVEPVGVENRHQRPEGWSKGFAGFAENLRDDSFNFCFMKWGIVSPEGVFPAGEVPKAEGAEISFSSLNACQTPPPNSMVFGIWGIESPEGAFPIGEVG